MNLWKYDFEENNWNLSLLCFIQLVDSEMNCQESYKVNNWEHYKKDLKRKIIIQNPITKILVPIAHNLKSLIFSFLDYIFAKENLVWTYLICHQFLTCMNQVCLQSGGSLWDFVGLQYARNNMIKNCWIRISRNFWPQKLTRNCLLKNKPIIHNASMIWILLKINWITYVLLAINLLQR
jgi:hypothetical protein